GSRCIFPLILRARHDNSSSHGFRKVCISIRGLSKQTRLVCHLEVSSHYSMQELAPLVFIRLTAKWTDDRYNRRVDFDVIAFSDDRFIFSNDETFRTFRNTILVLLYSNFEREPAILITNSSFVHSYPVINLDKFMKILLKIASENCTNF
ncbi:Hypothetical predicted protein, partial [Paramuricea clavata]